MQNDTTKKRIFDVSYKSNGNQHDVKVAAKTFEQAIEITEAQFSPDRFIAIIEREEIFQR